MHPEYSTARQQGFTMPEILLAITLFALAALVLVQALTNADMAVTRMSTEDRYSEQALLQVQNIIEAKYRDDRTTNGRLSGHPLLGDIEWSIRAENWENNLSQLEITLTTESGIREVSNTVLFLPN